MPSLPLPLLITSLLAIALLRPRVSPAHSRDSLISPQQEHVLILGASSGVGEGLVKRYASRGARICIVARRKEELERVKRECLVLFPSTISDDEKDKRILVVSGDISDPDDMLRIQEVVVEAWNRIDTVHIISGLPSTQTLLSLATTPAAATSPSDSSSNHGSVDKQGLVRVNDEIERCSKVNISGVGLAIATFLPLLSSTSPSPLIHHLSSLAALIPAPTRALYSATKAGGLALFRTAGWEQSVDPGQKKVRFLAILPGTIETGFRRKSTSAERGFAPSEEFEKRTLSVDQTVDAIISHSSLLSIPISLSIPFTPLALRIPFLSRAPNDLVFLPEWPYRIGYWALDTGAVKWVRNGARKKYGLE